ncbi:F-box/FBD/LRR-repeat protein At1g13570 isoform X2 [Cajanus cajan]|uniref:F-box/FBD/LRR-repeat protein At1g13570 isoform X2 n=1 Tax=Cajanus cajan TaxID=3821 RepID=UPI00098D9E41|nr:F-box/FBD/LRR-repeat protein At1g13570 isoform X2 [Cajanus cajan]
MIWYQKKAYLDDYIDRISDLPRNVIGNILQYLPIQEQVRTSILSRKWRHKWASAPQLEFNGNFFEKCHESGVDSSSLVTEVLLLHNGPLHKCTFYLPPIYYKPVREECISKWILFLARKGVKVLELENIGEDTYQTPSHVFSCHDLTYLHLGSFILSTVPNFHGFKSLVDLNLYYMKFESCAFECLVSGCPSLLKLTIYHCSGLEDFYVSSALKSLHIEDDEVIKSICLKQTQNLASITLLANGLGDEIDREWVTDLFKDLSKLERLSLGTAYIEILSAGVGINLQVLLKDVKHLELKGVNFIEARELFFIIHLLESCSNLEKLVIKLKLPISLHLTLLGLCLQIPRHSKSLLSRLVLI